MNSSLAGLIDPSTGLVSNRNDPRLAMALKLMDQKQPEQIYGKGAAYAQTFANVARGLLTAKLMGDVQSDGKEAGERQRSETEAFMRTLGMGAPAAAGAPSPAQQAAPVPDMPEPAAPAPQPSPAGKGGGTMLASAVHHNESGGRMEPGIWGDGGKAAGPMQVHAGALQDVNQALGTSYTHQQLAAEPAVGKRVGDQYLGMMRQRFGRDDYALGAFNAGPGAMQAAIDGGRGIAGLSEGAQSYVRNGMARIGAAPAAPALDGPAMAAKLDGAAPAGGGPKGQAMAQRMSPEQMQSAALVASSSPNPQIRAMAPVLAQQAQQQVMARERQEALGIRQQDRQDAYTQRQGDQRTRQQEVDQSRRDRQVELDQGRSERRQSALDARVPAGFRWTADRQGMEAIPGGPADARAQSKAEASTFGNSADGRALDIMNRLGGRYREGAASPEERQLYETAATHYTQPRAQVTERGVVQVTPQLPPGMPTPGQFGPQAAAQTPAGQASGGGGQPGDGSTMPGTSPLPGVRVVRSEQRDPPQAMASAMLNNADALRRTQSAMEAVTGNPGAIGPGLQFFPSVANWFNPSGTVTRAMVADIGSLKIHDRSGAAVTASEYPRLVPFTPSIGDTREAALGKLGKFMEEYKSILRDQYEVYGPRSGYRQLSPIEALLNPAGTASAGGQGSAAAAPQTGPAGRPAPGLDGAPAAADGIPGLQLDPASGQYFWREQGQGSAPAPSPVPSSVPAPPPGFRIIGGG